MLDIWHHREFLHSITSAIYEHAATVTDERMFRVGVAGVVVSLTTVILTAFIFLRQKKLIEQQNATIQKQAEIAEEQAEITKKQSEIMEQQNKIALFDKRYEIYKIFKEIDSKMLFELLLHQKNEIPIYKLITNSLIHDRKNIFTNSIVNQCLAYNSHDNSHEKLLEMVILFFREKYRNIQGKISFLFSQEIEAECNYIYYDLISILEHVHSRVDDDRITPILELSIKTQDHFKKNVLPLMERSLQIDEKNKRFNLEHKLLYVNVETKENCD